MGDIPLYRRIYAPLLLQPLFAPSPDAYEAEPANRRGCALRRADELEAIFRRQRRRDLRARAGTAGPVRRRQCACTTRLPAPGRARSAIATARTLIADEIAVGFGRTEHPCSPASRRR
jgi:adenosylmethionine-8-amino-7-oxononanoate aminotransferase